jgi:ABC-type multidrug transport system ATPase subunit
VKLEIEHLCKRFGSTEVLRDVSLVIPSGARAALIGPNGSGKSTLIRAVLGFVTCEGSVLLDGKDPIDDRDSLARRVAYVPQVAPQLAAPVEEVIGTVAELRGLDCANIAEVAREMDLHVADLARRPFRALSGGMKQKLLIALALAADAELLVMDEPTASLDDVARASFVRLLEQRAARATILLCSHRLDEVRHLVGRVVTMAEGRVASDVPEAPPGVRRLQMVPHA